MSEAPLETDILAKTVMCFAGRRLTKTGQIEMASIGHAELGPDRVRQV